MSQTTTNQTPSEKPKPHGWDDPDMLVGFQFVHHPGRSPRDFLTDPTSKRRPHETIPPKGYIRHDLSDGWDKTVVPPAAIWAAGKWYSDFDAADRKEMFHVVPVKQEHEAFVVSGEGTPGNYAVRIYIVPKQYNVYQGGPPHPTEWAKKYKEKTGVTVLLPNQGLKTPGLQQGYYNNGGWQGGMGTQTPTPAYKAPTSTPAAPAKPKAPSLPANVRMMCHGCGHWHKMDDLAPHKTHCCPGNEKGRKSDWSIGCVCCDSYDESSKCKDGFPDALATPKPKAKPKPKPAAKKVPVKAAAPEPVTVEVTVEETGKQLTTAPPVT